MKLLFLINGFATLLIAGWLRPVFLRNGTKADSNDAANDVRSSRKSLTISSKNRLAKIGSCSIMQERNQVDERRFERLKTR